jgi:hypothetical protein
LGCDDEISQLTNSSKEIESQLLNTSSQTVTSNPAVPLETLLSASEAELADRMFQPLFTEILRLMNKTATAIKVKAYHASNIYKIIFAVGSLIVIFAKLLEWRFIRARQDNNGVLSSEVPNETSELGRDKPATGQRPSR